LHYIWCTITCHKGLDLFVVIATFNISSVISWTLWIVYIIILHAFLGTGHKTTFFIDLKCITIKLIMFDGTCWRLFQKRIVCTNVVIVLSVRSIQKSTIQRKWQHRLHKTKREKDYLCHSFRNVWNIIRKVWGYQRGNQKP
jgi:hypothetical protein